MSLRRIRLAKRLKSFKRLRLIPRFCDFGISSTFDAVLRYLPIFFFLRYCGICRYFLRYCGVRHHPMSPSDCICMNEWFRRFLIFDCMPKRKIILIPLFAAVGSFIVRNDREVLVPWTHPSHQETANEKSCYMMHSSQSAAVL